MTARQPGATKARFRRWAILGTTRPNSPRLRSGDANARSDSTHPNVPMGKKPCKYLRPVCLRPTCLCASQRDSRLSMQPVMRCMLQSACEELIRKQQRPSHINRHECVRVCGCVYVCVCLGSLPGTLTAVCRPTGVLIRRGRQTEMNSDPQRDSTVHV